MTDTDRTESAAFPDRGASMADHAHTLEQLAAASLIGEAEDLTRGVRYISVATGDPETDDDIGRINALTAAAWAGRGDTKASSIRGGSDYLTIRIQGPQADTVAADLAAVATELNPGHWRITRSANPF